MLAIVGASGKIGGATLSALLSYKLVQPSSVVAITSSHAGSKTWESLAARGVNVRHGNFDEPSTMEAALQGCNRFFMVSTPRIELDYNNAPEGQGREKHHRTAIDAARRAGVKHLYYTSLAFGSQTKSGVMRAHLRTEAYLATLTDLKVTVVREGLYNESWPLYLGYYDPKDDDRGVFKLAGDGKICWTAIEDLGLANALVLTAPSETYAGRMFYLSTRPEQAKTVAEVAALVAKERGKNVSVEQVDMQRHVEHYVKERGREAQHVEWWVATYEALKDGECLIDDLLLTELLESRGRRPIPIQETVAAMIRS